jgi:HPt (histidine-containing phosphotransfer) domain-containing protein
MENAEAREVPEMLKLLAAGDFTRLATLCHNLKGSGGGFWFPELTRLGDTLEQLAEAKVDSILRAQVVEL